MGTNNDLIKREFDNAKFTRIFNDKFLNLKTSSRKDLTKSAYKEELADCTDKEIATVKDWFRRHSPLTNTIYTIAEFLGVSFDDITTPIFLSKKGNKSMINKKMLDFGIKDVKKFKITEYRLWNGLTLYLRQRTDTSKNELYTLYLEDFCLCDISPENAEDEDKLIDIMNDIVDDDCILDYADIAQSIDGTKYFPEPELLLRKNAALLEQKCKEGEEYLRALNIDINEHSIECFKEDVLKLSEIK